MHGFDAMFDAIFYGLIFLGVIAVGLIAGGIYGLVKYFNNDPFRNSK